MAYNPFINENIRDCYFDYQEAMFLRFLLSRISTIRSTASQQVKLGFLMEEKVTAPSMPKSDHRIEFGLGFSDKSSWEMDFQKKKMKFQQMITFHCKKSELAFTCHSGNKLKL